MANTYLTRTAIAGNQKTFTISVWLKRSQVNTTNYNTIFSSDVTGNNSLRFTFNDDDGSADDKLMVYYYTGSHQFKLITNRQFRDVSAWYHIVLAVDTTQATSSDRVKIYVNGVQETSFATSSYPSQNLNTSVNENSAPHEFGRGGGSLYFNGIMSHVHFIDGTAYDATAFGEYDANGVWKPILEPSVTYGTNGSFILKDGNSVTDQSGNSNNFTVAGGTLTNTEDSPSNVFATMNSLDNYYTGGTFTNGNNTVQMTNQPAHLTATMGVSSGKWYWEAKMSAGGSARESDIIGVAPNVTDQSGYAGALGSPNHGVGLRGNGNIWYNDTTPETGWNTWNQGDIVMIALDLDNQKIFWGTNGTWGKSSEPVTGTNGFSLSGKEGSKSSGFWFAANCCREISQTNTFQYNFGNGYFGTTAVASAGTNASGNGIFEFDVPTGYTALSTKGLNL